MAESAVEVHPVTCFLHHSDKWEKASMQRTSVEVFQDISLMTLDNIMKCAFSSSTACQTQRSVHKPPNSGKTSTPDYPTQLPTPTLTLVSHSNSDCYIRAVHEVSCLVSKRIQAIPYGDAFYGWTRQGCRFQDACKLAYAHTGISPPFSPS